MTWVYCLLPEEEHVGHHTFKNVFHVLGEHDRAKKHGDQKAKEDVEQ